MSTATLPLLFFLAVSSHGAKEKPELSEEILEIIQHVHNECVGKTGVAEEDIKNCENGIFKEDRKLKCYMFCLLEEASLVDDDGNVDYDMMVSLIPDQYFDRVHKMIFGCKHLDTPDKDNCQRAFDVHKCSYEKDPSIFIVSLWILITSDRHKKFVAQTTRDVYLYQYDKRSKSNIFRNDI